MQGDCGPADLTGPIVRAPQQLAELQMEHGHAGPGIMEGTAAQQELAGGKSARVYVLLAEQRVVRVLASASQIQSRVTMLRTTVSKQSSSG